MNAEPELVYKALTREATIELWSGLKATMQEIPDTEFSLFDQSIEGRNISFGENSTIVQEWYFGDLPEPSIVTIKLHAHKKGTSVEVNHTNIPDADFENMEYGWDEISSRGCWDSNSCSLCEKQPPVSPWPQFLIHQGF
mgnify:CR=1 FL=1